MKRKKVMVFGVFDGVHDGHRALFVQARKHAPYLVAVVTQDHIVQWLKRRLPERPLTDRIDALKAERLVNEVAMGDAVLGAWAVLFAHRPSVIAVGYDQAGLRKNLKEHYHRFDWKPRILTMKAHRPKTFHSSLMKKAAPAKSRAKTRKKKRS
jgi:FAD synthetase